MMALFWIIVVLLVLALAAYTYWVVLLAKFPEPILVDETHTVTTPDLWEIRLFRLKSKREPGEPVLLCHGMGSNRLNFLLPEGHSLAEALSREGYDCWLIDLRGNRSSQPPFGRRRTDVTVEDYVLRDLPSALQYIRRTTGFEKVHWLGHSMGGMLLYAYEVFHGNDPIASGVTLASPPGFKGTVHKSLAFPIALLRYLHPIAAALARGLAPCARFLRLGKELFPINWDNLRPEIDTRFFLHALELPSPTVLEEMNFWAANQVWRMQHDKVDVAAGLKKFKTPLFAIFVAQDPFVSLNRGEEFVRNLPNRDKQMLILSKAHGSSADYGHVDVVFGAGSEKEVFEPIIEWLQQHPIGKGKPAVGPRGKKSPRKKRAISPKARSRPSVARSRVARRKETPR